MKKLLLPIIAAWLCCVSTQAEDYTFSITPGVTPDQTETLDNGATRFTFPAGTDLNSLGLTCTVPSGATVTPEPSTARIRDNEPEVFTVTYADGTRKAFPYYFTAGRWFTVVLFGDPEINMTDRTNNNATADNLTKWANNIVNLKGSKRFAFKSRPEMEVGADLVICMGDMDKDSESSGSDIKAIFDIFTDAGIPFITMCGNHDLVPDYWTGSDPDYGVTLGGGHTSNKVALEIVTDYLSSAQSNGVENVARFTQSSGDTQPLPFSFTFKGVRFYVGQTYWFQKPYSGYALSGSIKGNLKYYAPNGIISSLESFLADETVAATPSIWIQHYPISCEDRWWLDQNDTGMSIAPEDTPTCSTAAEKRNKYMELIAKTKNPVHFSGHNHWEAVNLHARNGVAFKDYVAPYFATSGGAYVVLCHEGEGVKEVRTFNFDY